MDITDFSTKGSDGRTLIEMARMMNRAEVLRVFYSVCVCLFMNPSGVQVLHKQPRYV